MGQFTVSYEDIIQLTTTAISTTMEEEEKSDLPLGLGEDCGVFGLICWQLYSIALGFLIILSVFIFCFCRKTRKDIRKGKFTESKPEGNKSRDVEMQSRHPESPSVGSGASSHNIDENDGTPLKTGTENLDL